jgi:hypothetical protein
MADDGKAPGQADSGGQGQDPSTAQAAPDAVIRGGIGSGWGDSGPVR